MYGLVNSLTHEFRAGISKQLQTSRVDKRYLALEIDTKNSIAYRLEQ